MAFCCNKLYLFSSCFSFIFVSFSWFGFMQKEAITQSGWEKTKMIAKRYAYIYNSSITELCIGFFRSRIFEFHLKKNSQIFVVFRLCVCSAKNLRWIRGEREREKKFRLFSCRQSQLKWFNLQSLLSIARVCWYCFKYRTNTQSVRGVNWKCFIIKVNNSIKEF